MLSLLPNSQYSADKGGNGSPALLQSRGLESGLSLPLLPLTLTLSGPVVSKLIRPQWLEHADIPEVIWK